MTATVLQWFEIAPPPSFPSARTTEPDAASRRLLDLVEALTGSRPAPTDLGRHCAVCGSTAHGRRVVTGRPELALSLSRAGGHAVAAAAGAAGVGIDAEVVGTDVDRLAEVALGPDDRPTSDPAAVLRTWVRKEAVLKAVGVGLSVDPASFAVSAAHEPAAVTAWRSREVGDPRPLQLVDLDERHELPPGLVASLAVTGTSLGPVTYRVVGRGAAGTLGA